MTQPDRPFGRKQILKPSPVKERALALSIPVFQPGIDPRGSRTDPRVPSRRPDRRGVRPDDPHRSCSRPRRSRRSTCMPRCCRSTAAARRCTRPSNRARTSPA
ncbi:MAG: hypothetical protein MZU97_07065 [Bacillus subtilis]|nr:hypothetical protein [Bacillus subtilis]